MLSLLEGLFESKLLSKIWFKSVGVVLFATAALYIFKGITEFRSYQHLVESCAKQKLVREGEQLARNLKQNDLEYISARLNTIEYSCAMPFDRSSSDYSTYHVRPQADFFWSVSKSESEVMRIGKSLLAGPTSTVSYPLSIWSEGNSGDYWVGTISLKLYFGDHVEHLTSSYWSDYGVDATKSVIVLILVFAWIFFAFIRPTQEFTRRLSDPAMSSSQIRNLIGGRRDELSGLWRAVLTVKEASEVERFEFESQIRELDAHISKVERGQVGQNLSTEQASSDIKSAIARTLALHARASHDGDKQAAFLSNYLSAVLSVSANLHERALMESGEVALSEIPFSLRVFGLLLVNEFKRRFERRNVAFTFEFDEDLPLFVEGDPQKIRRITRNAFKRLLLEPSLEQVTFSISKKDIPMKDTRYVFELVGQARKHGQLMDATESGSNAERGPTSMLEMLCYIMGARWVFSKGLDGELTQSLSLRLPSPAIESASGVNLNDLSVLSEASVLVYDLATKTNSCVYETLSSACDNIDYTNLYDQLLSALKGNPSYQILVVSDLVPNMSSREFLSELRRCISSTIQILVVSESPQAGDVQEYSEIGVQGLLSRSNFAHLGLQTVNYMLQTDRSLGHKRNSIVTRYSVIDFLSPLNVQALPADLAPNYDVGTVLLIAEELVCIEFTRQHCEKFGAQFVHYKSAFEAVDAFRQEAFELVLVDDAFTDIDTLTVIEMLRNIEGKRRDNVPTPVIALGNMDQDSKDIYLKGGATDAINKYTIDGTLSAAFKKYLNCK